MYSIWGRNISYSLFGESHGKGVGITIHGLKSGIKIDYKNIRNALNRRKTGRKGVSQRCEEDNIIILSGEKNGHTTGSPLTIFIENKDAKKTDYNKLISTPRPSHADYVNYVKNGEFAELSGGGHFSARLTAPIVAAGALVEPLLKENGIEVLYNISQIGKVTDNTNLEKLSLTEALKIKSYRIPMYDENSRKEAEKLIENALINKDSLGARISCTIIGLEAGLGEPFFESMESKISSLMFSIPAVKAIEFGLGVRFAEMTGSMANDPFVFSEKKVITKTNNSGGINGGITNGMPLSFALTFRPTPSIGVKQNTVDLEKMKNTEIEINGRHDPCVALRAGVIIESMVLILLSEFFC